MELIRRASYDLEIFDEAMKETKHDMTAFLRAMYPSVGSGARYLHLGLTTSDVWDTALSMQMVEAVVLLLGEVDRLIRALESKAREHKDTVMIGRTHGVHAEPITFGLKLALWVDEMRRNRERLERLKGIGGGGEDLGSGGDVCPGVAGDRGTGVPEAGVDAGSDFEPDSSAGHPRRVLYDVGPGRRVVGEVRYGVEKPATH